MKNQMRTHLGRLVIRKGAMGDSDNFEAFLDTKHIKMTDAEKALVDRYLKGELSMDDIKDQLMNLPLED